jgi:hypothetical protein
MTVVVEPETPVIQHLRVALPARQAPAAEPAPVVEAAPVEAPRRLPRTNDAADSAWLWVLSGIMLMSSGIALSVLPSGRRILAARAAEVAHLSNQALLADCCTNVRRRAGRKTKNCSENSLTRNS